MMNCIYPVQCLFALHAHLPLGTPSLCQVLYSQGGKHTLEVLNEVRCSLEMRGVKKGYYRKNYLSVSACILYMLVFIFSFKCQYFLPKLPSLYQKSRSIVAKLFLFLVKNYFIILKGNKY